MKWDLKFFEYGEWDVIKERLADLRKAGQLTCPERKNLFKALELTPFEEVKVAIIGQDPYPDPEHATGVAFSLPPGTTKVPPTYANLIKEYEADLHYPAPKEPDLTPWCGRGVLLWNAIPSCTAFKSLSHNWTEWTYLTKEIVESLSQKGCVFVFLGAVAREYAKYVEDQDCALQFSHPAPRGARFSFLGSRLFSTVNSKLVEPIDWRL